MPAHTSAAFSRSHLAGEFAMQRNEDFLEAMVAACAAVAYADGWVTVEERRRLLAALRHGDALRAFPAEDVVQLFDEITRSFADDHEAAEETALALVAPFRSRRRQARQIIDACCAMAAADSQIDGEERAVLLRLCTTLCIDPAEVGLAEPRNRAARPHPR